MWLGDRAALCEGQWVRVTTVLQAAPRPQPNLDSNISNISTIHLNSPPAAHGQYPLLFDGLSEPPFITLTLILVLIIVIIVIASSPVIGTN